jgi:cytochrome c biogenesis protein CcdA
MYSNLYMTEQTTGPLLASGIFMHRMRKQATSHRKHCREYQYATSVVLLCVGSAWTALAP